MATTSVSVGPFSFSGWDPTTSFGETSLNGIYGGWLSNFWNRKSEKRAYQTQLNLMKAQYAYAQRYAENSPSWNVTGLRNAGLNPILAVSNGVNLGASTASVPSVNSHSNSADFTSNSEGKAKYDPLYNKQMENLAADTEMKKANASSTTMRAQADVEKSKAEATRALYDADRLMIENRSRGIKSTVDFNVGKMASHALEKSLKLPKGSSQKMIDTMGLDKGFSANVHVGDIVSAINSFRDKDYHFKDGMKPVAYSPPNTSSDKGSWLNHSPQDAEREFLQYLKDIQEGTEEPKHKESFKQRLKNFIKRTAPLFGNTRLR